MSSLTATNATSNTGAESKNSAVTSKQSLAIWYWVAAGIFWVGVSIYIHGSWIISGDAHFNNPGITEVPEWMYLMIIGNDLFWLLCILTTAWYFVISPKLRTGKFSWDGLFVMSFITCWWQDPIFGIGANGWSYATTSINFGSWACHIPGWNSPGGCNVSEPLFWDFSFYFVLSAMGAILGAHVMKLVKSRYPSIRDQWLWIGLFIAIVIFDYLLEFGWVVMGMYHYAGVNDTLAIFDDSRLKFPIWEGPAVAWLVSLWTAIIYYKNDKGETLVERGLSQVKATGGKKTFIRFLAICGGVNVMFLIGYSMPAAFFQYHAEEWPQETMERSYFTNEICAGETTYTCAANNMPVPNEGYVHISPKMEVIVPVGRKLPQVVPFE